MVEFIIIFWFAISMLMLVLQIALMFNAHTMVKLAAFNAARAAIVARSDDTSHPEKPVTLDKMTSAARNAAFLTIIPVIPGMHARLKDGGDVIGLFKNLSNDLSGLTLRSALGGYAKGVPAMVVEFFGAGFDLTDGPFQYFSVKFVKPTGDPGATDAKIESIPQTIEFDDTSKTDLADPNGNNLVKVVVEWHYPLIIPFADQIIYALTHGRDVLAGQLQQDPALAIDTFAGLTKRPVWEVGWVFRSSAFTFANFFGFRVPIRASYLMRMQWDRGPDS
jgi:hypothetical protein